MKIQKLTPHIKDYIWGGDKLITKYGKASESGSAAESWELSFHKDGLSLLENGDSLAGAATDAELGENLRRFKDFPVLIKLIDAKNDLSIQVHPSDDYALKYENSYGKTEMWYIVEAEEGAGIYLGFNKDVDDCVTITLGTGIGSGVVTGGRLYRGNASVGCEIGHSVIVRGGEECNCGRSGCFEAYASATALIRATVRAMKEHPESAMNEVAFDKVNGKTAFDYYATDPTAKSVIDEYLGYLSCGIVNVSNAYRPQKIVIGGGLCKQKIVIKTLQKAVNERSFGGRSSPKCKVVAAKNGNDAGILGAASLWMDRVR